MDTLFTQENLISAPIGEGDAGVVIKSDMTWQVFNTHKNVTADTMTETQIAQGKRLLGLAVALRFPAVMEMLIRMSNDPDICSQTTLIARPYFH